MTIKLLSIGQNMPQWVEEGSTTYRQRLPNAWRWQLHEIPMPKRTKNQSVDKLMAQESDALLAKINPQDTVIALAIKGHAWSSLQFAKQMQQWLNQGRDCVFLIGGPDGLAPPCLARADFHWSLSALTLPHPLVRLVFAEQLYRAYSLLTDHPYHRE